jgi:hypothetical protein
LFGTSGLREFSFFGRIIPGWLRMLLTGQIQNAKKELAKRKTLTRGGNLQSSLSSRMFFLASSAREKASSREDQSGTRANAKPHSWRSRRRAAE